MMSQTNPTRERFFEVRNAIERAAAAFSEFGDTLRTSVEREVRQRRRIEAERRRKHEAEYAEWCAKKIDRESTP